MSYRAIKLALWGPSDEDLAAIEKRHGKRRKLVADAVVIEPVAASRSYSTGTAELADFYRKAKPTVEQAEQNKQDAQRVYSRYSAIDD